MLGIQTLLSIHPAATRTDLQLLCQIIGPELFNALSADFAWRVARWALEDHIATNHPDQDPIVLHRNT